MPTPLNPELLAQENAKLKSLAEEMLGMLSDLHENFGWDELNATLEDVTLEAVELGVNVSRESSMDDDTLIDNASAHQRDLK